MSKNKNVETEVRVIASRVASAEAFQRLSLRVQFDSLAKAEQLRRAARAYQRAFTTHKEGRAREMAEKMVGAGNSNVHLCDSEGYSVVNVEAPYLSAHESRDTVRGWLADALRAYGDELLEKAADNAWAVDVPLVNRRKIRERILALKSSATKGTTNG